MLEHQPHATATFFELAIALSVLAWRTFCSIDLLPDPPQTETERIIQQLGNKISGLTIINHRYVCKCVGKIFILLIILSSVGGLIVFGTGWLGLGSNSLFWFSVISFIAGSSAAAKAETARLRRYSETEKVAAKTLEKFSNGE